MVIAISSGHGQRVAGARDLIDEVTEARRVVDRVHELLAGVDGVTCLKFHENEATSANANVNNIVRWHNAQKRNLDVSVHFNSVTGGTRDAGIGVETLHLANHQRTHALASNVSRRISEASGLILRRGDGTLVSNVGVLRLTSADAILIEVCFVNSRRDVHLYNTHFEEICVAIAEAISGKTITVGTEDEVVETNQHAPSDWAVPFWDWGIVNELTDGTNPKNPVTRQEVITMLHSYTEYLKREGMVR